MEKVKFSDIVAQYGGEEFETKYICNVNYEFEFPNITQFYDCINGITIVPINNTFFNSTQLKVELCIGDKCTYTFPLGIIKRNCTIEYKKQLPCINKLKLKFEFKPFTFVSITIRGQKFDQAYDYTNNIVEIDGLEHWDSQNSQYKLKYTYTVGYNNELYCDIEKLLVREPYIPLKQYIEEMKNNGMTEEIVSLYGYEDIIIHDTTKCGVDNSKYYRFLEDIKVAQPLGYSLSDEADYYERKYYGVKYKQAEHYECIFGEEDGEFYTLKYNLHRINICQHLESIEISNKACKGYPIHITLSYNMGDGYCDFYDNTIEEVNDTIDLGSLFVKRNMWLAIRVPRDVVKQWLSIDIVYTAIAFGNELGRDIANSI